MKQFDLSVMTANKTVYRGKAVSLVVPGGLGSMGILADHTSIISTVQPGTIAITPPDHDGKIIINVKGGGFVQVKQNKVMVIIDSLDTSVSN